MHGGYKHVFVHGVESSLSPAATPDAPGIRCVQLLPRNTSRRGFLALDVTSRRHPLWNESGGSPVKRTQENGRIEGDRT